MVSSVKHVSISTNICLLISDQVTKTGRMLFSPLLKQHSVGCSTKSVKSNVSASPMNALDDALYFQTPCNSNVVQEPLRTPMESRSVSCSQSVTGVR